MTAISRAFAKEQASFDAFMHLPLIDMDRDIGHIVGSSAEQALENAEHFVIDLAIVDVFMPGKGGIWVIDQLRERFPEVKIVSVSGGWGEMTPSRAVRASERVGADAILTKPLSVEELEQTIRDLLEL